MATPEGAAKVEAARLAMKDAITKTYANPKDRADAIAAARDKVHEAQTDAHVAAHKELKGKSASTPEPFKLPAGKPITPEMVAERDRLRAEGRGHEALAKGRKEGFHTIQSAQDFDRAKRTLAAEVDAQAKRNAGFAGGAKEAFPIDKRRLANLKDEQKNLAKAEKAFSSEQKKLAATQGDFFGASHAEPSKPAAPAAPKAPKIKQASAEPKQVSARVRFHDGSYGTIRVNEGSPGLTPSAVPKADPAHAERMKADWEEVQRLRQAVPHGVGAENPDKNAAIKATYDFNEKHGRMPGQLKGAEYDYVSGRTDKAPESLTSKPPKAEKLTGAPKGFANESTLNTALTSQGKSEKGEGKLRAPKEAKAPKAPKIASVTPGQYAKAEILAGRHPNMTIYELGGKFHLADTDGKPLKGKAYDSRDAAETDRSKTLDRNRKFIGATAEPKAPKAPKPFSVEGLKPPEVKGEAHRYNDADRAKALETKHADLASAVKEAVGNMKPIEKPKPMLALPKPTHTPAEMATESKPKLTSPESKPALAPKPAKATKAQLAQAAKHHVEARKLAAKGQHEAAKAAKAAKLEPLPKSRALVPVKQAAQPKPKVPEVIKLERKPSLPATTSAAAKPNGGRLAKFAGKAASEVKGMGLIGAAYVGKDVAKGYAEGGARGAATEGAKSAAGMYAIGKVAGRAHHTLEKVGKAALAKAAKIAAEKAGSAALLKVAGHVASKAIPVIGTAAMAKDVYDVYQAGKDYNKSAVAAERMKNFKKGEGYRLVSHSKPGDVVQDIEQKRSSVIDNAVAGKMVRERHSKAAVKPPHAPKIAPARGETVVAKTSPTRTTPAPAAASTVAPTVERGTRNAWGNKARQMARLARMARASAGVSTGR